MLRQKMAVIFVILALVSVAAWGQVTTGTLGGQVTSKDDGSALPGAQINAVHEPTGSRYSAVTRADGRFTIPGLRVGPYTVIVSMDGFGSQKSTGITVRLGDLAEVEFALDLESISETVTVTAEASPLINPSRTGASSNVSLESIDNMANVSREFSDYARTNPFFTVTSDNDDPDSISVAGRSSRYNNIQIDGAVNNDLFGLADQGTPGGQADTSPISMDAIQELQLVLSDFDVRQGGFSGGSVNAITRSGSNQWQGSLFYFTRDDSLVGDGPKELGEFGTFSDDQYGFRLGGPIARDKAFFFINGEISEKLNPTGWSLDGSGGTQFANGELEQDAQDFRNFLVNNYGFDPGGLGQQTRNTDSDKFFGRLDLNLSDGHQLTVRHNFVDATNVINRPGDRTYEWESESYDFANKTNSTVLQLNSVLGADKFNELRLTYQTIEDRRGAVSEFPWIEIENVGGLRKEFEVGGEPFSTNKNALNQDVFELTDDFTMIRGNHTFTMGTHNELFSFENLFIPNAWGSYEFSTLEDFYSGISRRYRRTFANPGQDEYARFDVNQYGLYVGDQWTAMSNLTLTYGLRVDVPYFPDSPDYNPLVEETFGFRTDVIPDGNEMWSPRLGFNWDITGEGTSQLRGGLGIFAGRTPYVWISNQYSNTGSVFTSLQGFGVPFEPDINNQPTDVPASTSQEVNMIDPGFEFPQVLRINLAYDMHLPWWGLLGTVEAVYSDSQKEIDYQNLAIRKTGELRPDGRPVYEEFTDDFSGAFLLKNTSQGSTTNVAFKIEKPFSKGFSGFFSYAWGDAKSVNDGSSSRAVSNWQFNEAVDPNNVKQSTSVFEVEHRFNASATYNWTYGDGWGTTASLFWNHQSGRPYATIYDSFQRFYDVNGDGWWSNDLIYVPSGPDDVVITNGTWEQLDAYIRSDNGLSGSRGDIVGRNASNAPWNSTLDLHLAQDIPVGGRHKVQVTFDILNLMNLFDSNSGQLKYVQFNTIQPWQLEGYDEQGRPIINLDRIVTDPENNSKFVTHNVRSRWRARLGLRWSF